MAGKTVEMTGEGMTVVMPPEIDHHAARLLRAEIDGALRRERPTELVFDMKQVSFMDSSGLGLLLGRYTKCREAGITVKIINPCERVYRLITMAGIEKLMLIIRSA